MDDSNAAAKKLTLMRHRAAFDLWFVVHQTLEDAVIGDRKTDTAFRRALDLLFIQAFKSHGSLYSLCVLGHCEDAATIARRILEIALQIGYLDSEDAEQENRGRQYLAYFCHIIPGIIANPAIGPEERSRWQALYDQNKKWLRFTGSGRPLNNWSGLGFADMTRKLQTPETYEQDYRFLSNMAHSSSAGFFPRIVGGRLQITDDTNATPILIYGTRYMLAVTEIWNGNFNLIKQSKMVDLRNRCITFDFQSAADNLKKFS